MTILETTNLTKTYGQGDTAVKALDEMSIKIQQGFLTAIIGRSGSGKSTLLNLLGGLDMPTSGTVSIEGVDLFSLSEKELSAVRRRRIGFVFQDFQLMPEYTVKDNVLMPLYLDKKSADAAYFNEIVDELEISKVLEKQPWQLSGGQQQRVAIARAIIARPAIVLADEPTGNLDVDTGERVFSLLSQISKENGQTVVYVTHDVQLAQAADEQISISDGRVINR